VQFSTVEDARRVVFSLLGGIPASARAKAAAQAACALRDEGLLASSVEQHYSAVHVAKLLDRSPEYVKRQVEAGEFGPVCRDGGGWLIPASGVALWLARRVWTGA
jgi:hypothetical protein